MPVADPAVGPGRFDCRGDWASPPRPWPGDAVERLRAHGARQLIRAALDELPAGPRRVVLLCDVEGLAGGEVCELLGISEGHPEGAAAPRADADPPGSCGRGREGLT